MTNLVSIIIPCYDDWQYIEQAVNSALSQTYTNKEVIVIDDGSDAKTKAVLKTLEHKVTKLITQENKGQSTARNVGIASAKGKYILVLDSDDFFEPTFCEKAILVFTNSINVKLVSCEANLIFDNGEIIIYKPIGGTINDFLYNNSALGTSMFRKTDWLACGGYDESMREGFEDWEFFIRLLKNGGTAKIIQEPLYNYRKRTDSTTALANSKKFKLLRHIFIQHENLYKNNFDSFVNNLLYRIERQEIDKVKNMQKLEYRIGKAILKPLRFIKAIFN